MLELDVCFLEECFVYEGATGKLFWKHRPVEHFATVNAWSVWNAKHAGRPAGGPNSKKRWSSKINGRLYQNHRIIWALANGSWPKDQIDHINGDPEDNRLANLRVVTNTENQKNRWRNANNASGINGVYWHTRDGVWTAHIREGSKQRSLGYFPTQEQAVAARREAEGRLGYSERHGEVKAG